MKDLFRETAVGQILNVVSGGRILPYPDQRTDFVVPRRYDPRASFRNGTHTAVEDSKAFELSGKSKKRLSHVTFPTAPVSGLNSPSQRTLNEGEIISISPAAPNDDDEIDVVDAEERRMSVGPAQKDDPEDGNVLAEKGREDLAKPHVAFESQYSSDLVEWYGPDDQDNPRNWSLFKRSFVAFSISLLTFSVYIGSAIYTSSIPDIVTSFGVSQVKATLGLTLYILAYGVGPMFLAPFQELPSFGRNPIYIGGLALFVLFNVPIILAKNFSTVLAFRFLSGFVGSPALATGGASMGDLFPDHLQPYVIGIWAMGAQMGPILGPVIGGFAAQAVGWKWPIYELMWMTGFALIFLALLLPETYEANILLKRARRLRKLTGNQNLRSQSEIDEAAITKKHFLYETLVQPFVLAIEPALLFANVFLGLVYSVFYLWFEAFPLVFNDIYGFNLGVGSLPYIGFAITSIISYAAYYLYLRYHMEPREARNGGTLPPESRLEFGLMASIFIPISLLMFGWGARESVHWMFPIVAASLYVPGIYLTFQSILMYVSKAYPKHITPVFAGNDLFRSSMASAFPLFGRVFFTKLGLGPGCSLLAGVSIVLMFVYYLLIKYGAQLRARSRYAE